jgi:hypothetical protein
MLLIKLEHEGKTIPQVRLSNFPYLFFIHRLTFILYTGRVADKYNLQKNYLLMSLMFLFIEYICIGAAGCKP